MAGLTRIAAISAVAAVAFVGLVAGKWYHTAALEPVDPAEGVYGMAGLEIWIDINARMPGFARTWGCETLRAREREALGGQNSLPPYSCQPGFGMTDDRTAYQTAVEANLAQAVAGLDAAKADALRTCFESRMAAAVTPEEIAAMNDFDQSVMSKVIMAVSESIRACKAEAGG